jgi:hypothetical protein
MSNKIFFSIDLILLIVLFQAPLFGDDHVVEERTRTYMGRTIPPMKSEIWIGSEASCYKTQTYISITRYDLKKRYMVNLRNKKYLEEPLDKPISQEKQENKKVRIQELGAARYEPVFDWIVEETNEERIIDDRRCRLFILEGDADYAEEKREMWVTKDVPIDISRFFERMIKPGLENEWIELYEKYPELRNSITVESVVATEGAIAPTIVWNNRILTIETADPPEGIYSVPAGFTQVKTRDELYSR